MKVKITNQNCSTFGKIVEVTKGEMVVGTSDGQVYDGRVYYGDRYAYDCGVHSYGFDTSTKYLDGDFEIVEEDGCENT